VGPHPHAELTLMLALGFIGLGLAWPQALVLGRARRPQHPAYPANPAYPAARVRFGMAAGISETFG